MAGPAYVDDIGIDRADVINVDTHPFAAARQIAGQKYIASRGQSLDDLLSARAEQVDTD